MSPRNEMDLRELKRRIASAAYRVGCRHGALSGMELARIGGEMLAKEVEDAVEDALSEQGEP